MRIRLAAALTMLVGSLAAPASASPGRVPPTYASQVLYGIAPIFGDAYAFQIDCQSSGSFDELFLVKTDGRDGTAGSTYGSPVFIHGGHHESDDGNTLILDDDAMQEDRPREEHRSGGPWNRIEGWSTARGDFGPILRVYLAIWGDPVTCIWTVDGRETAMTSYLGPYALYAGPESFHTGLFRQDGDDQISLARRFEHDLPGGVVAGHVVAGDRGEAIVRYGGATTQNVADQCVPAGDGATFGFATRGPTSVEVTIAAGIGESGEPDEWWELHGHSQLWMIYLPGS